MVVLFASVKIPLTNINNMKLEDIKKPIKKSRSKKLVKWIEELRKSRKHRGSLFGKFGSMCCLGVYCNKVEGIDTKGKCNDEFLNIIDVGVRMPFIDFYTLSELASINDNTDITHKQIADWLEENLLRK